MVRRRRNIIPEMEEKQESKVVISTAPENQNHNALIVEREAIIMDAIEKFEINGKTVEIHIDTDPESPREWDNLGEILYMKRSRETLGDRGVTPEEMNEILARKDIVYLPVYAYVHSGVCLNTTGYSCPWDSGQSGIIFVTKERILKEYSRKIVTKKVREAVKEVLRQEVETYSKYLGGEVYGYQILDQDGGEIDSCWGIFGLEYCRQEATESAKSITEREVSGNE